MEFTLDVTYFGTGIGLVLVGWAAGLVVSYVFSLINIVSNLGGRSN